MREDNAFNNEALETESGRGAARQRTRLGCEWSAVQIGSPRPINKVLSAECWEGRDALPLGAQILVLKGKAATGSFFCVRAGHAHFDYQ